MLHNLLKVSATARYGFSGACALLIIGLLVEAKAQSNAPLAKSRDRFPGREFVIGFKGGAGAFNVYFSDTPVGKYILQDYGSGPESYYGGVFARQESKRYYFQLEVIYAFQTDFVSAYNLDPGPFPYDFTDLAALYRFKTLYFPLSGGYRPLPWLRVFAGPYLSYGFKDKLDPEPPAYVEYRQIFQDINNSFRRVNAGGQVGVGAEFWRFTLDVQYSRSLTPYSTKVQHQGENYPFRPRAAQLSVMLGFKIIEL